MIPLSVRTLARETQRWTWNPTRPRSMACCAATSAGGVLRAWFEEVEVAHEVVDFVCRREASSDPVSQYISAMAFSRAAMSVAYDW